MSGPRVERLLPPPPPLVTALLMRRREVLLAEATGAVLEIGVLAREGGYEDCEDVESVETVGSLHRVDDDARFDTIICCCGLPAYADLPAAARAIAGHLTPVGRFRFIEPVGLPGLRGAVLGLGSSLMSATAGLHLDRDVPSALRSNGLVVVDIERFTMPTMIGSLRHWAQGSALRRSDDDRSGALDEAISGDRP